MTNYERNMEEDEGLLAMMLANSADPQTFEEAWASQHWREAMKVEMEAIEKNNTWQLVDPPTGVIPVIIKWDFNTKFNENGRVEKYKARLVAKGYSQRYGIDYTEVFALVVRLDTVRLLLALVAQSAYNVFQLDVKSAFLHGDLQEAVYVQQPAGFIQKCRETQVYRLQKALYGLKQAPRAWYHKIETYFDKEQFNRCSSEHTLFTKTSQGNILMISLYVDDLLFTRNNKYMCEEFKSSMKIEFDMTNIGKMKYFLGIEVVQSNAGIFMSKTVCPRDLGTIQYDKKQFCK